MRAVGLDTELTRYFDTRGLVRETWPGKEDYLAKPPECVTATIAPAGIGVQMVRLALPLPDRFLHDGQRLVVADGRGRVTASVRPLSWYGRMIKLEQPPYNTLPSVVQNVQGEEPPSVRRALVTFPYTFKDLQPVAISLQPAPAGNTRPRLPVTVRVQGDTLIIAYRRGPTLTARLIAPPAAAPRPVEVQTVESNAHILWQLYRTEDADWSRILDVRADAQGTVAVTAYLQRSPAVISPYNGEKSAFDIRFTTAPDFGWDIATRSAPSGLDVHTTITRFATEAAHDFAGGQGCAFLFDDWRYQLYHPVAPFTRRGSVRVTRDGGATAYRYLRCSAADRVPMQSTAWRRAEFVVAPAGAAALSPTMAYPHGLRVDWRLWDGLYGTGAPLDLARQPALAGLVRFHHDAIVASTAHGDDFGNITSFDPAAPHRAVYHMLRLNHGPEIFFEGWRSGDRRLVDAGVLWCQNFRDMSIWWGPQGYGGTRYPYAGAQPKDFGRDFGWRSDEGLAPYCLKGIDAFFLAYEETGDPLMLEALGAQAQYAARFVHTSKKPGDGNPRSIGVVLDFVRLYRYTGQPRYLDEALRLFRELRDSGALTGDQLFTESGGPPTAQLRFIPHDGAIGETFYKPYILGYGLEGLPELAVLCPTEPRLRETVRALADFMAKSADSLGAWRYPHPRSPGMLINQAPEHAAQLMNAGRALGTSEAQLDAIEAALRLRLHGWQKTGAILGLSPWEAGPDGRATVAWETRYTLATERDAARDYAEGAVNAGGAPIEGLVYVPDVLRFYLAHRPAARLLAPPAPEAPLGQVLSRANAPAP